MNVMHCYGHAFAIYELLLVSTIGWLLMIFMDISGKHICFGQFISYIYNKLWEGYGNLYLINIYC